VVLPLLAVLAILSGCGGGASSGGTRHLASMFQDDQFLLYQATPVVVRALDQLRALGVEQIRVTVLWRVAAPAPDSPTRPSGFVATDPAGYPPAAFAVYDRVLELARARGITVDFNVTAAGPLWAMKGRSPQPHYTNVYEPSATEFHRFVTALGRRYSGKYVPSAAQQQILSQLGTPVSGPLPRVGYWSIWNEPNQPGWLSPQWTDTGNGRLMISPVLYRQYVDTAWTALVDTGHAPSRDTILIGELAPEGGGPVSPEQPIPPMAFLRALYCVDPSNRPLSGPGATSLGCPANPNPQSFSRAHPGLFDASGFGHHPYSFFLAPNVSYPEPDFVPLISLSRLERGLDSIFTTYGVARRIPIYLTEYGYETNPPNPFKGVSLQRQATYINEAQYLAWKDPRVRAMAQFLLIDSLPDSKFPPGSIRYWSTFQTGLEFANGTRKPSFAAYRLPIWVPTPTSTSGKPVLVWGMLRPASPKSSQRAEIQWRAPAGAYRTLATVTVNDPNNVFTHRVKLPGSGFVRLAWRAPAGQVLHSRAAPVQTE
jgi:hypothetical protein